MQQHHAGPSRPGNGDGTVAAACMLAPAAAGAPARAGVSPDRAAAWQARNLAARVHRRLVLLVRRQPRVPHPATVERGELLRGHPVHRQSGPVSRPTAGAAARAPSPSTASLAMAPRWAMASRWRGLRSPASRMRRCMCAMSRPCHLPQRQGVRRGDQVLSVNGRSAANWSADDFSRCSPPMPGRPHHAAPAPSRRGAHGGGDCRGLCADAVSRRLRGHQPARAQAGYVVVKDMISQALAPLDAAFASFKSAGVHDVVLDLRYNGGGLVSTGATLASYVAGSAGRPHLCLAALQRQARRQQPALCLQQPGGGRGAAACHCADGAAHLLGQRTGHQRPARRRASRCWPWVTPAAASRWASCPPAPAARPTAWSTSRASMPQRRALLRRL
jgi:hypothetical protein